MMRLRQALSDYASPVLVKELRQGLRARGFALTFLLMQGLLMLILLLMAGAASAHQDLRGYDQFFWACAGIPLVYLMPLRALGAIYEEYTRNTLELVYLSSLTPWRIAAGKYVSMLAQAVLMTVGILPYVVVRYFLGAVNVTDDMKQLAGMLLGCAVATALMLALSGYRSKLLRVAVIGLCVMGGFGLMNVGMYLMVGRGMGGGSTSWSLGLWCIGAAPMIFMGLAWAADLMSPPAINGTLLKRIFGLSVVAALLCMGSIQGEDGCYVFALVTVAIMGLDAFGERPRPQLAAYARLLPRGVFGRLAALFFTPGWPSAAWFSVILFGMLLGGAAWIKPDSGIVEVAMTFPAALLFAPAMVVLFKPDFRHMAALNIGSLASGGIVAAAAYILRDANRSSPVLNALVLYPPAMPFLRELPQFIEPMLVIVPVACVVVLILRQIAFWKEVRRQIEERNRTAAGTTPPPATARDTHATA
jgi:ABC-type transport system involved in multi-copper enzyme maturation permease subunit